MRVRILFFGMMKDIAGCESESADLPEAATLADLSARYENRFPQFKKFMPSLAMSVNQEYAGPQTRLKDGDEIAFLPPVSGGMSSSGSGYCAIVREPIDTKRILEKLKQPEDGSALVFEGVVRDHTRGRKTLYLDYEAYEEMALKQMKELAGRACTQFQIRDVAMVHRLGRLQIGETSVLIVVASAHRAAAFEACRWLIDTLKQTVPIWKKEYFEDGAVWAAGEPFPAEILKKTEIFEKQAASNSTAHE